MINNPNYFAILPAAVRYDPNLSSRTILLYAMLSSLAKANGEAYASNKYLADALDISEQSVKRYLRELNDGKYINVVYEYDNGTKEIARRLIYITELPLLLDMPNTQALYAVIPSHILCNSLLSPQAKLLYAEISAATPKDGYCSKPATFFANLLHASEPTVRRWIKELQDVNAIHVEMEYKGETKEIRCRRIYLTDILNMGEKLPNFDADGSEDTRSITPPNSPNTVNTPQNEQIRGMLKFVPTPEKRRDKKRRQHDKRKKATEKLLL